MVRVQWVVFKHHKKTDGTYNPKILITHKRTNAYIPTGIDTELVRFRKGSASGIITDQNIEDALNLKVYKIRSIINEKEDIVPLMNSAKEVKDYVLRHLDGGSEIDFLKFADEYIDTVKNKSTRSVHVTRINALREFVIETTGKNKLPIPNITHKFLKSYEEWLGANNRRSEKENKEGHGLSVNSINAYLGEVSIMFNAAKKKYNDYDRGDIVIKNDPFKLYSPPKLEATEKRAVSREEIRRIYEYSSYKQVPQMTRDLFVMSFFLAGMNVVDFFECPPFSDRIEYTRVKTRTQKKDKPFLSLMIHPAIADIVEKYRDKDGVRGFDFYKRYRDLYAFHQALRRGISAFRKELGLVGITFYAARHSFATIARNECNVSMDDIAQCLTHQSGHDITDTYVKRDFSRIDNVINKVADYIFEE